MTMTTASLGIMREDGDFAILATFNNNDCNLSDKAFEELVHDTCNWLNSRITDVVQVLERQDAPDYVCVDEGCWG